MMNVPFAELPPSAPVRSTGATGGLRGSPMPSATSPVGQCLSPAVLQRIHRRDTGLVLWRRWPRPSLQRASRAILALPEFCHRAEGAPADAVRTLTANLPKGARPVLDDLLLLARLFATLTDRDTLRIRLERVSDNACRHFHVDRVGLRLLCTYAGPGTEWQDAAGRVHRIAAGTAAVLKGSLFPDNALRVPHRSPPVEHLPSAARTRLLLCLDQPGVS